MKVIGRRIALLFAGVLALWALVELHRIDQSDSEPRFDVSKISVQSDGNAASAATLITNAVKGLQKREQTAFEKREEVYAAIDGALVVPMPAALKAAGSVSDGAATEFEALVVASADLAKQENDFRTKMLSEAPASVEPAAEYKSTEAQLARFVRRRQRLNQLYLSRAAALTSYEAAIRQSVRRYLDTLSDSVLGKTPRTETKQFFKDLASRKHPLHVVFDMLWYAALAIAVICFTAFLATGLLALLRLPELTEAFRNRTAGLLNGKNDGGGGGGGRTATTVASAAAIALLGVGTIAGTVGGASSSPWEHASILTAGAGAGAGGNARRAAAGATGPSGAPGTPGTPGTPGGTGNNGNGGLNGSNGWNGENGENGENGVVVHRVEVDPIKLDASAIELFPQFAAPPPSQIEVKADMPAPPRWIERFAEIDQKIVQLDDQVNSSVQTAVDSRLKPVEQTVDALAENHKAALASASTVDKAGLWAWLPWHREYRVGDYETTVILKAVSDFDEKDMETALALMNGQKPLRYFDFVSALRRSVTEAMAAKQLHLRDVDGFMDRNTSTVLSVCRVRR